MSFAIQTFEDFKRERELADRALQKTAERIAEAVAVRFAHLQAPESPSLSESGEERAIRIMTQMSAPYVGRDAVAALLNKSVSTVDRISATGVWGAPKTVLGSPLWKRDRVIETIENGELAEARPATA